MKSLLKTSQQRPIARPFLLFALLCVASVGLFVIQTALDGSTPQSLATWLRAYEIERAKDVLSNLTQVLAAVLGVAVTVVAIVVELAANRYSHEITRLFLREPVNLVVLGLLVITTVLCVWTIVFMSDARSDALLPHAGFVLTLGLGTLCLLLLVPYMYFVFTFLSPVSVIERICKEAYGVIQKVDGKHIERDQRGVLEAIDELQDVTRSALQQGDRSIAMASVNAMATLLFDYAMERARMPPAWFAVSGAVAEDPDFIALAPEYVQEVREQGTWLEQKIFRRYVALMGQASPQARDVAYLIGINTGRIAMELGNTRPELLELSLRTFNSYLRTTIGSRDQRTAYYVMHLYRQIAAHQLEQHQARTSIKIATYIAEYGRLAQKMGLTFLLETAAHDLVELIEEAADKQLDAVDPLLDILLDLDEEARAEDQVESLLGVRRAQIQLATGFLLRGWQARADRVVADLATERPERLERLRLGLETDDRQQYWELTDRGTNFAWLPPSRRPYLKTLFDALSARAARTAGDASGVPLS